MLEGEGEGFSFFGVDGGSLVTGQGDGPAGEDLFPKSGILGVSAEALQPGQVVGERVKVAFQGGVAASHQGQAIDFGLGVGGVRDQFVGVYLEEAGQEGNGTFSGNGKIHFDVGDGHAGDGQTLSQVLLGPAGFGSEMCDSFSDGLEHEYLQWGVIDSQ